MITPVESRPEPGRDADPETDPETGPQDGPEDLMDTSLDRYARLVQHALGVPVALVSLVEERRQWFPGMVGLPEPWATCRETPLSHSFCQHVVARRSPLVVTDARETPLVADNLAIPDLGVIAYAGFPITDHTGNVIGSLCAIDTQPRAWPEEDLAVLADLADACSTELAQRGLRLAAAEESRWLRHLTQRSQVLLSLSRSLAETQTTSDIADALAQISREHLGCLRAGIWLRPADRALALDRTLVGAPATADPGEAAGEMLRYVPTVSQEWQSAAVNSRLTLDRSNPVGACLLEGKPRYYAGRDQQNAEYPHLVAPTQIGQARAFLPLVTRTQVYGVLTLVWEDAHEIPDEYRVTMDALAAYTSEALQRALLFQDRMEALVTMQSALMPRLPDPDDLSLAARYLPAATLDQIGGDWFDAVVMPNGRTALMIGDVIGHDIAAAAKMGQVRSMLRAFALAVPETPSESLQRLDHALVDLDMSTMASLVYAQIVAHEAGSAGGARHMLCWSNAGHPPPLLVGGDGSVAWLDGDSCDTLVGVAPELARTDHQAEVPAGSTVLLFTDGLVERRGEDLTAGLARLAHSVQRHHDLPVEDFLDAVLADMVHRQLDDDVAMLAIRFA